MAEYLRFVDAPDPEDDAYQYSSAEYAEVEKTKLCEGIAYGYLNQLEITQSGPNGIMLDNGALASRGRIYIQSEATNGTSPKTLSTNVAGAVNLRKDRVVIEYDLQNATAKAKIVQGSEEESNPGIPGLIDEDQLWQISLAILTVDSNGITDIEDERVIGNTRVNPVFTDDVSAPNMTTGFLTVNNIVTGDIAVKDGGVIFLNNAKTAYLRYTNNALYLKLPDCVEVQMPGVVVGTSPSAPIEDYPINTIYLERD